MANTTQLKLAKGIRVALRVAKARWQPAHITATGSKGFKILTDRGDIVIVPAEKAALYLTPIVDQKLALDAAAEYDKPAFDLLTTPPELLFAKAPAGGTRVVYREKEGVFYAGTVSGVSGNFTYVVLDSAELTSPVKVATESAKLDLVLDSLTDKKAKRALDAKEMAKLTSPNYSALLASLQELAEAEQSGTPSHLAALCAAVVRNKRAVSLSTYNPTSPTLYTVVPQDLKTLKRNLQERSIPLKKAEFSLWDALPQTTAHRIGVKAFGVVAEWRPPKGATAVDIGALISEMLGNEASVGKLNKRENAALYNLHRVYTQTKKYILGHVPDSAYIAGILTANKQFLKQLRMMDIEHVVDSGTGVSYMRLFQISNSLDELGLT